MDQLCKLVVVVDTVTVTNSCVARAESPEIWTSACLTYNND